MKHLLLALLLMFSPAVTLAQDARVASKAITAPAQPVFARHGMVVAQERLAAEIGADVLKHGGNAVDAAVATGFAMAVTYPRAGNIGGGGFMVIHLARDKKDIALDYRETAPAAATAQMFLGADGKPDPAKSRDSALGIGVPGTVAGLIAALERYGSGKLSLRDLLAPAIKLARKGFIVTDDIADTLTRAYPRLSRWPTGAKMFARADGTPLRDGDRLKQTDLADTLQAIADHGTNGFYQGPVAEKLAAAIQAAGGVITPDDLKAYRPVWREPVRGTYRGYDIVSMPLPSSGGTVLIETLNILEGYDLRKLGAQTPASLHVLIEAMKRAYADRARYLGDPAFVNAPLARLMSKNYAAQLRRDIDPGKATAVTAAVGSQPHEGTNTTHFSVVDAQGNAVSNTYTLNFSYGVGLVAEGTGVLLNNELDDFTAAPGAANAYGLVGYDANLPGHGKRPLSSMTPTIVLKDGKVVLVTGSPGGSRIISTTLQVIVNTLDHRMSIAQAVSRPRLHHQWRPDEVRIERGFPQATLDALRAKGHGLVAPMGQTSANSIAATKGGWLGAADPRTRGATAAGY
ncbi:gamma-glutamyltransferase [Afipia carboxidovorans]|nr:gamma-glutamyltransferase [Afipia carboxidovorans]